MRIGAGRPCPPVCNDIVTPRHLLYVSFSHSLSFNLLSFFLSVFLSLSSNLALVAKLPTDSVLHEYMESPIARFCDKSDVTECANVKSRS